MSLEEFALRVSMWNVVTGHASKSRIKCLGPMPAFTQSHTKDWRLLFSIKILVFLAAVDTVAPKSYHTPRKKRPLLVTDADPLYAGFISGNAPP